MTKTKKLELVQQRLAELESMDATALKAEWHRYFKQPPLRKRREYLISNIAYKIQEKAYCGLSRTVINKLERMAFGDQQASQPKYKLTPGTQLVREWNGKRYHVTVTADGFEYDGRAYRSLTKIATEITGARWSGLLFFGLRKQENCHAKAA
ncbi:MAG: DUF2924 domain-containing protein [Rickettsiales bacterium]|nr:DUF2924 domain-containing protein [Rickettsiales bacterium]